MAKLNKMNVNVKKLNAMDAQALALVLDAMGGANLRWWKIRRGVAIQLGRVPAALRKALRENASKEYRKAGGTPVLHFYLRENAA